MIPGPRIDDPEALRLWVRVTNLILALKDIQEADSQPCVSWGRLAETCGRCYKCLAAQAIDSDTRLGKMP